MAVEKSYARLGLFLVVALTVVLVTALFFLQRMRSRDVLALVTYTNENVSGLDISSPVRFKGVSVGRVTDVRVDPRNDNIEIGFELFLDRLVTFGFDVRHARELAASGILPLMRAQIVSNPVTGEAYVLLDRPVNPPPPIALNFKPTRTYVPSMPTMMSKVEDRLPELLERANATLTTLREIISRLPHSLDRSDLFFAQIEQIFRESDLPALSADSRKFLAATSTQLAQLEQIKQITSDMNKLIETLRLKPPTFRGRRKQLARRWTAPTLRQTTSADPCPRFGNHWTNCDSSRGCWRTSRSRSFLVSDILGRKPSDPPMVCLFPCRCRQPGGSGLPTPASRHHSVENDRAAGTRAGEAKYQRCWRGLGPVVGYTRARAYRSPITSPATEW